MVGSGMATGEWTGSGKWQEVQEAAMEIPPSLQQIESNDLTKIKELGRGQFGSVWLCRCAVSYSQAYHSINQSIHISCLWDSSGESTDSNWEADML